MAKKTKRQSTKRAKAPARTRATRIARSPVRTPGQPRALAREPQLVPPRTQISKSDEVTIVGVGASAGGLEAFSSMIRELPPKPGFAIVLVQHLAPQHESALPTLLTSYTSMPVVQVTEGMRVEARSCVT